MSEAIVLNVIQIIKCVDITVSKIQRAHLHQADFEYICC